MDKVKSIVQEALTHNTLFPYLQDDKEACKILQSELERLTEELLFLKERNALPDNYQKIERAIRLQSQAIEGTSLQYGLTRLLVTHNLLSSVPKRMGSQIGVFFNNVYQTIFAMVGLEAISIEELAQKRDEEKKEKQKAKRGKRNKSINHIEEGAQRTSKMIRHNDDHFIIDKIMRRKHPDY